MDLNQYGRLRTSAELDLFLENGWFRTGLYVFTCQFIDFEAIYYRTIWLRHNLWMFNPGKTWKNLQKRNHAFRVEISEATITPAQEALYRMYRQFIFFEPAKDIRHLLFDGRAPASSSFHTKQLCIYHNNELIGCSYFDLGEVSAAGISAFYHPNYARFSLGIYMIYYQILACKKAGFQYYYPGYFIPHYSHFDYKLRIGTEAIVFFHPENRKWLPLAAYTDIAFPHPFFKK